MLNVMLSDTKYYEALFEKHQSIQNFLHVLYI